MKRLVITQAKSGTMNQGTTLPRASARPASASSMPAYMGFLLKENGPVCTRDVEGSNGLTVVPASLKRRSAQTLRTSPATMSKPPARRQGMTTSCFAGATK